MTNLVARGNEREYISDVRLCKLPLTRRRRLRSSRCEIKRTTRPQRGMSSLGYAREKYIIEVRTCILGISVISYANGETLSEHSMTDIFSV